MKSFDFHVRAIQNLKYDISPAGILFDSLESLENFLRLYMKKCRVYREGVRLVLVWDHPTCLNINGMVSSEFVIGLDPSSCPSTKNFSVSLEVCERIVTIRLNSLIRRLNLLHFELNR